MKKQIMKYCCDVCSKEVKSADELKQVKIPVDFIFDRELKDSIAVLDICQECKNALKEVIKENFAEIVDVWYGGIETRKIKYK